MNTHTNHDTVHERRDHLQYLLTAYLFENISPAGKAEVEAHLAACAECRDELTALRATLGQVQDALEPEPAASPYSFEARRLERVLQSAKGRRSRWEWLREKRGLLSLAAAAVVVVGLGLMSISIRSKSMPGRMADGRWRSIQSAAPEAPAAAAPPMMPPQAATAAPDLKDVSLAGDYAPAFITERSRDLAANTAGFGAPSQPGAQSGVATYGISVGQQVADNGVTPAAPGGPTTNELRLGHSTTSPGSVVSVPLTLSTTDQVKGLVAAYDWEAGGKAPERDQPAKPAAEPQPAQMFAAGARRQDAARTGVGVGATSVSSNDSYDGIVNSADDRVLVTGGGTDFGDAVNVGGKPASQSAEVVIAPKLAEKELRDLQQPQRRNESLESRVKTEDRPALLAKLNEKVSVESGFLDVQDNFREEIDVNQPVPPASGPAPARRPVAPQKALKQTADTNGRESGLALQEVDALAAGSESTRLSDEATDLIDTSALPQSLAEGDKLTIVGINLTSDLSNRAVDFLAGKDAVDSKARQQNGQDGEITAAKSRADSAGTKFTLGFEPNSKADFDWGTQPYGNVVGEHGGVDHGFVKQDSPADPNQWVRLHDRQPRDGLHVGGIIREKSPAAASTPIARGLNELEKKEQPLAEAQTQRLKVKVLAGTSSRIEGLERFSFPDTDADTQSFIDLPPEKSVVHVTKLRTDVSDLAALAPGATTQTWSFETAAEGAQAGVSDGRAWFESNSGFQTVDLAGNGGEGRGPAIQTAGGDGGGGNFGGRGGAPSGGGFGGTGGPVGGLAGFGNTVLDTAGAPAIAANTERQLRAFHYYRELDPALQPEVFFQKALTVPPPAVGDEGLGEVRFRGRYGVNPFVDTSRDHFSTFGMDVDTASYTLARANLVAGKLPDPKTVRVEEFINHFREAVDADPNAVFTVRCEGGPSPFGEGLELLKITIKARELLPNERKNTVLTFAVDTSGSMNIGNRLASARGALETLLGSLAPEDRVAIVAFGATPYLVLPHTAARDKDRLVAAVRSLSPSGGTNVEAGLDLAYRVADEVFDPKSVNRVILCSDGVANVGARGPDEILRKVEVFAKRGLYLSAVGFGLGKYNDSMLETLANKGNGNYAYVDSPQGAAETFQKTLPSILQVLAQDAKIQVDFNPEVVGHYRLLGYENRDIADKDFRNDKVDAGEVGPGSTVTALYEIRRKPSKGGDLGKVFLRYRDTGTGRVDEVNYPLPPGVVATRLRDTSERFRFIACAAETAEILRGSYWARNGSFGAVLRGLESLSPETKAQSEWQDLATVVRAAQAVSLPQLSKIENQNEKK